jgi:nitrogen fixation/metabolism regulation signal transduction histidine kinase
VNIIAKSAYRLAYPKVAMRYRIFLIWVIYGLYNWLNMKITVTVKESVNNTTTYRNLTEQQVRELKVPFDKIMTTANSPRNIFPQLY